MDISISNLPIEIILKIVENSYIFDDLINQYKTCRIFNLVIKLYKKSLLKQLFKSKTFSNSYYNLFFSFINNKYEYIKEIPYLNLKQLLNWNIKCNCIVDRNCNCYVLINYFMEIGKIQSVYLNGKLEIYKDFIHLLFLPSDYIYNTKILLNNYFNIRGLVSQTRNCITIDMYRNSLYNSNDSNDHLLKILSIQYPEIIINHFVNFGKIVGVKKFKKILHNFVANLFIEWLFNNECDFIEKIYYKLYSIWGNQVQKIIYRIIYNEFNTHINVFTDDFVEHFYEIHRIFLPSDKIGRLYNLLELNKYVNL